MVSDAYREFQEFKAGKGKYGEEPYKERRNLLLEVERQMHDIPPSVYNRPFTI